MTSLEQNGKNSKLTLQAKLNKTKKFHSRGSSSDPITQRRFWPCLKLKQNIGLVTSNDWWRNEGLIVEMLISGPQIIVMVPEGSCLLRHYFKFVYWRNYLVYLLNEITGQLNKVFFSFIFICFGRWTPSFKLSRACAIKAKLIDRILLLCLPAY